MPSGTRQFMARRAATSVLLAAMLVVLAACGSSGAGGSNASPVKLGFITPLSGQYASLGTSFKNALELYLAEHGNKLGGRDVQLVTVDEGAGAASAVPGAQKLIQQENVDVVTGVVSSATAAAVYPLFEQAKIPVVFTQGYPYSDPKTDAPPYLWEPGSANAPFTVSMGKYMAEQVAKDRGVYFIGADYVQGHAVLDATKKAFEEAGGRVAGTAFAPLGTTLDYQPFLSNIDRAAPAAVWSFFAGSDAVRFVQQYKSFGLAGKYAHYSTSSLIAGDNLTAEGDAALDIQTNGFYSPELDNAANRQFVAAYRAKYDALPDNFAVQQYDNMLILDKALAAVRGELTADKIIDGLRGIGTLETPRGTWHIDKNSHLPVHSMYLFAVKDQSGKPVNVYQKNLGVFDPVTGRPVQ